MFKHIVYALIGGVWIIICIGIATINYESPRVVVYEDKKIIVLEDQYNHNLEIVYKDGK